MLHSKGETHIGQPDSTFNLTVLYLSLALMGFCTLFNSIKAYMSRYVTSDEDYLRDYFRELELTKGDNDLILL